MALSARRSARLPGSPLSRLLLSFLVAAALTPGSASAQPHTAVGMRAGTAGFGVDVVRGVSRKTNLRLAAGAIGLSGDVSTDRLDYEGDADVRTALLLLDWYPGKTAFRLSVGAGWNGSEVEVTAPIDPLLPPRDPGDIALYAPLGSAVGTARGNELVPAILVGWGNSLGERGWRVSFDVGAIYQGSPDVELAIRSEFQLDQLPPEQIPGGLDALERAVEEEERALERELEDEALLPVVSFTVSYSF